MQGYRSITSPFSNSANLCSSQFSLAVPGSCFRLLCQYNCTGTHGEQDWRAELGILLQGLLCIPNYAARTIQTRGWTEQCCKGVRATTVSRTTTPNKQGKRVIKLHALWHCEFNNSGLNQPHSSHTGCYKRSQFEQPEAALSCGSLWKHCANQIAGPVRSLTSHLKAVVSLD